MTNKIALYYNDVAFTPSESFLFKDFGQVPYVLSQLMSTQLEYWILSNKANSDLITFRHWPVLQFVKCFRLLPRRLDFLKNWSIYKHLVSHGRECSHAVVFPFTPISDWLLLRFWVLLNPRLKVVLKLDTNRDFLNSMMEDWSGRKGLFARLGRFTRQSHYYRKLLELADVIICETSECERILKAGFLGLRLHTKLLQVFSGVSETWLSGLDIERDEREPVIVVSGRISAPQKNTPLIFEAGPPPAGWRIDFIGPIDDHLATIIAHYRALDPLFDERYRFHGEINNKRQYFNQMMRARVLLMNSRGGEGFPNVFAEANVCDLMIVTSDVSGARDATDNGRLGLIYEPESVPALRAALARIPDEIGRQGLAEDRRRYRRRFVWEYSLNHPMLHRLFDSATPPVADSE